jgi:Protein of unknown function (DUF1571)
VNGYITEDNRMRHKATVRDRWEEPGAEPLDAIAQTLGGGKTLGSDIVPRPMISIIRAALLILWVMSAPGLAADAVDPAKWIEEAETAAAKVSSYTAIVHKQQRVAGTLLPEETIFLKFRKPMSLYMKWVKAPYKGSELVYAEGWNENHIRAHRGGLLRFIVRNLDPRDPGLMAYNLRPVTDIGIVQLVKTVAANVRAAISAGELGFSEPGEETVYGRTTRVLEIVFPKEKSAAYDGHRLVINQDIGNRILVRIRVYDRDDKLVENYGYENLDLDARLTDADFDPANSAYRF